jgi:hypothetical protein
MPTPILDPLQYLRKVFPKVEAANPHQLQKESIHFARHSEGGPRQQGQDCRTSASSELHSTLSVLPEHALAHSTLDPGAADKKYRVGTPFINFRPYGVQVVLILDFQWTVKYRPQHIIHCSKIIISNYLYTDFLINLIPAYHLYSQRMRWAGHVARIGKKRNAYRLLVGKPEGKRPLGRPYKKGS